LPHQIIQTMKTTISIMALVMGLGLNLNAQNIAQKNACIKVDIKENGKETKIDTCFNFAIGDSIKKMFTHINWDSLTKKFDEIGKQMSGLNIEIDSSSGQNGRFEKFIINDSNGKKEVVKITRSKNGKDNEITINGDGGENNSANAYTYSSSGKGQVVVKTSGNGNGSSITITEEDGNVKDSKGNTYKVYILKKVEIENLSSDDKKQLPQDVSNSINDAKPFTNLSMFPNPTDGNIRITYTSNSTEALKINVYDTFGKTVLNQVYSGLGNNVDQTISLSDLSKGIYFVQLLQGTQAEVRKIIVK
jgi:hypothetical protein